VNTARGAICDKDAIAAAIRSGHLNGYSGDVWNQQPAPRDHPWRTMKNPLGCGNGMVPHYSGTTLDAQARYAAGVKSIITHFLDGTPQEEQNVIIGAKGYVTKACEYSLYTADNYHAKVSIQTGNGERRSWREILIRICKVYLYYCQSRLWNSVSHSRRNCMSWYIT